jgi:hypothetical protein
MRSIAGGRPRYAGNGGSLPSEVKQIDGVWYHAVDGPFAAPVSAHTYDTNEFLPLSDRMIVFGGAAFNDWPGSPSCSTARRSEQGHTFGTLPKATQTKSAEPKAHR